MQFATVEVFLRGGNDNSVIKHVSAAEAAVLGVVHGPGSVRFIEHQGEERHNHAQVFEELLIAYGDVVKGLFPGINPVLPTRFSEIGLEPADEADEAPKKRVKRASPEPAEVE